MSNPTNDWVLYGLFRTDMASLSHGKGLAQAMHCGKHADQWIKVRKEFGDIWVANYAEWEAETVQSFGTSLTLDIGSGAQLQSIVEFAIGAGFPAGVTHDPTYPVLDGAVMHLIPVDTCGWIFGSRTALRPLLVRFSLHT